MDLNLSPELQSMRRRYSDEALRSIPKLLQLIDRNPYSSTYGSFDRAYWHYRTMDFPCGMAQEFCLPLALVYKHNYADNPYYQLPRMKELAMAGVEFSRKSAHADGSCDDYFPNERALGALVFSLYACTETCLQLDEKNDLLLEFFMRRANHLMGHNESGRLTNHQAFAALALHNVYELTGNSKYAKGRDQYLDIVQAWQTGEGWFWEYEGADPGYHSCSISFLGKLMRKTEGTDVADRILKMLRPAVDFAWHFMHPDGSYAGEYGSRNTYHFYPHGFELMAPHEEKAGQIADAFLKRGLPRGSRYFNEDDRMCAHYVYDWLEACRDFHPERPGDLNERPNFTRYFPQAKMLVSKTDAYYAVLSLAKGGVMKAFDENGPLYSDTGIIGKLNDGRVLVSHLMGMEEYDIEVDEGGSTITAEVSGRLAQRRRNLPTPFKQILFRMFNLTAGWVAPDLVRRFLQKILITGKPWTPYRFTRRFVLTEGGIEVINRINNPVGENAEKRHWESLHIGSDATSIYVANSNVYQESVLLPWRNLRSLLEELNRNDEVTFKIKAIECEADEDAGSMASGGAASAGESRPLEIEFDFGGSVDGDSEEN